MTGVSIPSSSGHQFTGWSRRKRPVRNTWMFQSLLHQGISLLYFIRHTAYGPITDQFQSLLHQGISLLDAPFQIGRSPIGMGFNPFFIRASVYCVRYFQMTSALLAYVSIPSSSGHQFTAGDCRRPERLRCAFQSLLHQGISLLSLFGCLGASALVAFQSLLHQGISLLKTEGLTRDAAYKRFQSLLHQGISLLGPQGPAGGGGGNGFQSLLHQGISLLRNGRSAGTGRNSRVSIPSSSGHQFTGGSGSRFGQRQGQRFNPFFIRASVYCLRI